MNHNQTLQIEKLKSGLSSRECEKIDDFFKCLDERTELPFVGKTSLIHHFIEAFEYYQDQGKETEEICELIHPDYLGNFYSESQRQYYSLDNAAIIYPLGMKYGQMPMFRLSAELKEEIVPCLLQLALDIMIRRFPTFSAVIKNGFFWHYLETVNNVPFIEKETDIPCKPISIILRSYRSFRVLYYKKRISVEFFHAITDGTGGMVFLNTLVKEYLRLKEISIPEGDGIKNILEEVDPQELVNEFRNAEGKDDFSTFVDKKSVQLDGKLSRINITRILHFKMNTDQLKQVSHKYDATITAYMTALMFLSAKKSIHKKEGLFNIQIPVNMRKFNHQKTLRNFSMYFNISIALEKITDKKELIRECSRQIKEKGGQEPMNQMMKTTGKLINSLSLVPLFIKVPIIQSLYGYFSNSMIGCTFSNLGLVNLPQEMKKHIDRYLFLLVPGRPNRVTTSMATINQNAVFTIIKNCYETDFEEEMYRLLKEDGIDVEVEGSAVYES